MLPIMNPRRIAAETSFSAGKSIAKSKNLFIFKSLNIYLG
nr:MAG TPA: protein of unknown function (DUF5394) [Caudoviricetes sp.]DAO62567.1 MAG TPA: protein of unknown function (DUF5394) [Caudoviricetes sp.]DAS37130.1 MAG TPA: protein of unknown function (DUF5394) [Caudoviricetes sp.]